MTVCWLLDKLAVTAHALAAECQVRATYSVNF